MIYQYITKLVQLKEVVQAAQIALIEEGIVNSRAISLAATIVQAGEELSGLIRENTLSLGLKDVSRLLGNEELPPLWVIGKTASQLLIAERVEGQEKPGFCNLNCPLYSAMFLATKKKLLRRSSLANDLQDGLNVLNRACHYPVVVDEVA